MSENRENDKWSPWAYAVVILAALACVVVLLVGLPVMGVMIVERLHPGSLDATISFWGAMFAAFISLAVTFIAGVFVFMTVKVETGAQREAREAATAEVKKAATEEVEKKIKETVGGFLENKGDKIVRAAADTYINEGIESEGITRGNKITRQAAGDYLASDGANITEKAADKYLKESIEGEGITRGEKIIRQLDEKFRDENILRLVDERVTFSALFRSLFKRGSKS